MVDLPAEHRPHGVDDARRSRSQAVDAFAGVVPGGHAGRLAVGIVAVVKAGTQLRVLFDTRHQQMNFLAVK